MQKENADKVIVVDFTASYCGPCKFITPIFEREAGSGKYPNMIFRKVDVEDVEELQERYEVTQMPTFIFFENGSTEAEDKFTGSKEDMLLLKLSAFNTADDAAVAETPTVVEAPAVAEAVAEQVKEEPGGWPHRLLPFLIFCSVRHLFLSVAVFCVLLPLVLKF